MTIVQTVPYIDCQSCHHAKRLVKNKDDAYYHTHCSSCRIDRTYEKVEEGFKLLKQVKDQRQMLTHLFRINTTHGYMFITKEFVNIQSSPIKEEEESMKFWIQDNTCVENLFDCSIELWTWWRDKEAFDIGNDVIMYVGCIPSEELKAIDTDEYCIANNCPWNEAQVILAYLSKRDNKDYLKLMKEDALYSVSETAIYVDDKYQEQDV